MELKRRSGWLRTAAMFALALLLMGVIGGEVTVAGERHPLVIAHRSASGTLPEHTLPGVAAAHAYGADFIEPDVVLTKDDIPIVVHDIYLDATTDVAKVFPGRRRADGRYYAVDFTWAEVTRLTVRERFNPSTGQQVFPGRFNGALTGLRVPSLADELALVQGMNRTTGKHVGVYPEFKAPAFHWREGKDIVRVVLATLTAAGYQRRDDPIFLQCFEPAALKRVRREFKSPLRLIQLIGENSWHEADADYDAMRTPAGLRPIAAYADGIGPDLSQVLVGRNPTGLVAAAHAAGLVVHPYTLRADELPPGVRDFDDWQHLIFEVAAVDGAFTDFTERTVAFLKAHGRR